MRKICIINQKGGVGKTTTAVNIASGLSREGRKVLLVDVDPQGNIAHSLATQKSLNLYHFLSGKCSYVDCVTSLGTNLDLMHSDESLTKIESDFATSRNPTQLFSKQFSDVAGYDYLIFDCAPSLGLLNQNVMLFCEEAIIPVTTHYLPMTGLSGILEAIQDINGHFGHNLKVTHIVPTLHDGRNKTNKNMLAKLEEDYPEITTHPIRVNAKLAEAPASGKSIFAYDKRSRGAKDYGDLVKTLIKSEKPKSKPLEPISMRVQRMMAHVELED
ncbi:MAG: ParA family protein [Nanoarchaeota archaeon]|nr:ParA family protein [Nanoarchaeota archaeon]